MGPLCGTTFTGDTLRSNSPELVSSVAMGTTGAVPWLRMRVAGGAARTGTCAVDRTFSLFTLLLTMFNADLGSAISVRWAVPGQLDVFGYFYF